MVRYDFGRQVDHRRPCARGQRPPEPSHPHSEETPEEKRDAWWVERVERARMVMHGPCAPQYIESIRALRGGILVFAHQLNVRNSAPLKMDDQRVI